MLSKFRRAFWSLFAETFEDWAYIFLFMHKTLNRKSKSVHMMNCCSTFSLLWISPELRGMPTSSEKQDVFCTRKREKYGKVFPLFSGGFLCSCVLCRSFRCRPLIPSVPTNSCHSLIRPFCSLQSSHLIFVLPAWRKENLSLWKVFISVT